MVTLPDSPHGLTFEALTEGSILLHARNIQRQVVWHGEEIIDDSAKTMLLEELKEHLYSARV